MTVTQQPRESHQTVVRQAAVRGRARGSELVLDVLAKYGLIGMLLIVFALFSVLRPETFFSSTNIRLILVNQSVVVLVALAAAIPLMAHHLDASVGPMAGLAQGMALWATAVQGWPVWVALALVLVAALLVGCLNAILVIKANISSIVVTLATGSLLAGLLLLVTGGRVIFQNVPEEFTQIARADLFGIPMSLVYLAIVVVVLELVIVWTPFGQRLYAMDGNARGAERAGIPTRAYTFRAFILSAVLGAFAGVLLASRVGSAQPELGAHFLLPAFAAAFLGAAVLRPGRINILGTVIAAYFVSFTISGLQQMGAMSWVEDVFNCLAVLVGVGVAQLAIARRKQSAIKRVEELEHEDTAPS